MSTAMVHVPDEDSNVMVPRPTDVLVRGHEQAKPLADLVKQQKLSVKIQGRDYVKVEGWTTLAAMNGVLPREDSVSCDNGTYIATVSLVRISDGTVLTRASAECGMDEPTWANRPNYARRSMAITRATGKACRIAFSWVMQLAGFEPCPLEEMDGVTVERRPAQPQPHPVDEVVHAEVVKSDVPYDPVVPFGKNKGTPVSKLTDSQLRWYWERVTDKEREGSLSTADGNWKEDLKIHMADRKASREKIHSKQVDSEEIPF